MTPQYFKVLQQYRLQFYYKANLDNSFVIGDSLLLTTNEIHDEIHHQSTRYTKLLIKLRSLFTKSYFLA